MIGSMVAIAGLIAFMFWAGLQENDPTWRIMHRLILMSGLSYDNPFYHFAHGSDMRHLIGFGLLGFAASVVPGQLRRTIIIAILLSLTIGLEVAQEVFTVHRSLSLGDIFHSAVGLFAGLGVGRFLISSTALIGRAAARRLAAGTFTSRLIISVAQVAERLRR